MAHSSPTSLPHGIYRDPHYGFSIRVPDGWQIAVELPNGAIIPRAEARLDPVDRIDPFPVYPGLVLMRGASELPGVSAEKQVGQAAR